MEQTGNKGDHMEEIHSEVVTKHFKFGCSKNLHLSFAKEEDGSLTFFIPGEKSLSCSAVWASFTMEIINEGLKRLLTPEKIAEIAKGHICKQQGLGFRSCVDALGKDIESVLKESGESK